MEEEEVEKVEVGEGELGEGRVATRGMRWAGGRTTTAARRKAVPPTPQPTSHTLLATAGRTCARGLQSRRPPGRDK